MPTIKTKKEMNLPELIEWGWSNDITNKKYICNEYKKKSVIFNLSGWAEFSDEFSYNPRDTFTVEVEEEITEDTVIPKMLEMSFDAYQNVVLDIQVNQSINTVKENAKVLTLHIINDDDTHTLIWRDGKLVE